MPFKSAYFQSQLIQVYSAFLIPHATNYTIEWWPLRTLSTGTEPGAMMLKSPKFFSVPFYRSLIKPCPISHVETEGDPSSDRTFKRKRFPLGTTLKYYSVIELKR